MASLLPCSQLKLLGQSSPPAKMKPSSTRWVCSTTNELQILSAHQHPTSALCSPHPSLGLDWNLSPISRTVRGSPCFPSVKIQVPKVQIKALRKKAREKKRNRWKKKPFPPPLPSFWHLSLLLSARISSEGHLKVSGSRAEKLRLKLAQLHPAFLTAIHTHCPGSRREI